MAKRFTTTGKNVFRDNLEGIYYVSLNDGKMITVENSAEVLATLAWSQASDRAKTEFLRRNNEARIPYIDMGFTQLPQTIKDALIEYQKSKMGKKP